jgi:hypothetical protein
MNSDIGVILILLGINSARQTDSKLGDFHWLAILMSLADHFYVHGQGMLVI